MASKHPSLLVFAMLCVDLIAARARNLAPGTGPPRLKAVRDRIVVAAPTLQQNDKKNSGSNPAACSAGAGGGRVDARQTCWSHSASRPRGCQAGRCGAVEPITAAKPVSPDAVDAIKPYVSAPVWAMVQFQLLTGMRSGESVGHARPRLNTSGRRVGRSAASHKSEHRGKGRQVFRGRKPRPSSKKFLYDRFASLSIHSPKRPCAVCAARSADASFIVVMPTAAQLPAGRACLRHAARAPLSRAQKHRSCPKREGGGSETASA